jgi:hypothetical protein
LRLSETVCPPHHGRNDGFAKPQAALVPPVRVAPVGAVLCDRQGTTPPDAA